MLPSDGDLRSSGKLPLRSALPVTAPFKVPESAAVSARSHLISIVVPCHNEAGSVVRLHAAVTEVMEASGQEHELLFVDDGSSDGTLDRLLDLARDDHRVRIIELSRNFGKEAALTAGLEQCRGDAVIPMDADLQDPPSLIPVLIAEWQKGAEVVLAIRSDRNADSWLKRTSALAFYSLFNRFTPTRIPRNAGDFRLMSRVVVDAVAQLPERNRFMKGLFAWVGFRTVQVTYRREARQGGESKFSGWKLWNFALEGITSFSTAPLRIWTYVGLSGALAAAAYGVFLIISTVVHGRDVPGYASLMVAILFLGSLQLTALGMIGEYIGRNYIESKGRPRYIIRKIHGAGAVAPARDAS